MARKLLLRKVAAVAVSITYRVSGRLDVEAAEVLVDGAPNRWLSSDSVVASCNHLLEALEAYVQAHLYLPGSEGIDRRRGGLAVS